MILQQRNGRRKCTKTKVKNSSFRNKYDRVETEDPEDVIVQPKNKGGLISECIMYYVLSFLFGQIALCSYFLIFFSEICSLACPQNMNYVQL
jgi:hypothetical protein